MRKLFLCLFLLCVTLPLVAELPGSIIIKNETGYQFNELFVAVEGSEGWGENLLGETPLKNGEQVAVNLPDLEDSGCLFDFLAVDDEGDDYLKNSVDLCSDSNLILFTFDDYAGSADYDDYEGDYDSYDDSGYESGYDEGYRQGYRDAFKEAFSNGYSEGFTDGREYERSTQD
jgi:hypothetical protein